MQYVPSFEAAEHSAAAHMRSLGYRDARVTQRGSDGGIDVMAAQAVAQVKWHMTPVGRPDIQKLYGARGTRHHLGMLFFAAVGYSAQAIQCADELGVALFAFADQSGLTPCNRAGHDLIARARSAGFKPPASTTFPMATAVGTIRSASASRQASGRRVLWLTMLFIFFWPGFVAYLYFKHPEQTKRVLRTVRDSIRRYPKVWACGVTVFGLIGAIVSLKERQLAGCLSYMGIALAGLGVLAWLVKKDRATATAPNESSKPAGTPYDGR